VLQKAERAEIGAEPESLQVVTLPQTRKPGEQSNPPGFSSGALCRIPRSSGNAPNKSDVTTVYARPPCPFLPSRPCW